MNELQIPLYYCKKQVNDKIVNDKIAQYTFLSIAKNNIPMTDIYLHFFPSIYKKHVFPAAEQITRESISQFFLIFIRIAALRNLIGLKKTLSIISFIKDFVDTKSNQEKSKKLMTFAKAEINAIYEKYYSELIKNKQKEYIDSAMQIQSKIKELLDDFFSKLQNQGYFSDIKAKEELPTELNDLALKRFIKNHFRCICNIHVLRENYKKQVWEQFESVNNQCWPQMKVVIIHQTAIKADKSNVNEIFLPKLSKEKNPIFSSLQNQIVQIKKTNKCLQTLTEINKSILVQCDNYHKKTKRFYPNLSLSDIYFDQRTLSPIISFSSLLLDAIGFKGDTKNFELRLATEPTPKGINYEECYLETVERNKALMNRKYYCPQTKQKSRDNDQDIPVKSRKENEFTLLEQVHTCRLINIFYFVLKGSHFSNDYYNGAFKGKAKQAKPKPFYYQICPFQASLRQREMGIIFIDVCNVTEILI